MALAGASPLKELTPAIRIDNPLPEDFLRVRHTFLVVPLKARSQTPRFYLRDPLCLKLLSLQVSIIESSDCPREKCQGCDGEWRNSPRQRLMGFRCGGILREVVEFGGIQLSGFVDWLPLGFLSLYISLRYCIDPAATFNATSVSLAREKQRTTIVC